jgi:hypothetical protein
MAQPEDLDRAAAALGDPAKPGLPWAPANAALFQLILRYSAAGYSRRSILGAVAKARKMRLRDPKAAAKPPPGEP